MIRYRKQSNRSACLMSRFWSSVCFRRVWLNDNHVLMSVCYEQLNRSQTFARFTSE